MTRNDWRLAAARWIGVPFAMIAGFFVAVAICGAGGAAVRAILGDEYTVERVIGLEYRTALLGAEGAFGWVLAGAWMAPFRRGWTAGAVFVPGACLAWLIFGYWAFPEDHPRAYESSIAPLISTLAGGIAAVIAMSLARLPGELPRRPPRGAASRGHGHPVIAGSALLFALVLAAAPGLTAQDTASAAYPAPVEGDYVIRDFAFDSGGRMPELRIHYRTIGQPVRDANGVVRNAVLVLHGTTGSGASFISPTFAGRLFGPGQLLDARRYYIILPDGIGHGRSSRPSEGMHARFPRYTYDDMVRAQHRLVTEGLGVNHLRLVMGTSMGGMHTWVWGYTHPELMDALLPLASAPVQIAGRNRMMRGMVIGAIRNDPGWRGGDYTTQPRGLEYAIHILMMMTSSPLQQQNAAPTRAAADSMLARTVRRYLQTMDANDMLYAFEASRDYDPSPRLGRIRAPLVAVNSADDLVNPPELGILEREIRRVPNGRYILIPTSDETRGHGTHSVPAIWGRYLAELLAATEPR